MHFCLTFPCVLSTQSVSLQKELHVTEVLENMVTASRQRRIQDFGGGEQPRPPCFYSTYAYYIQFCQHRGDVKLNETDMVTLSH